MSPGGPKKKHRSRVKRFFYRPEAALMVLVSHALRPLSLRGQLRAGRFFGRLFWFVSPRRAKTIAAIRDVLQVDEAEARRVARASHFHLGRLIVELLTAPSYLEPKRSALLEVEHFEHMKRAHAAGRGVVLVTAHVGNWELLAIKQALLEIPLLVLGREPNNPYMAARLEASRRLCGNRWLPRQGSLFGAAKGLKSGQCVATAIDQHTRSEPKMKGDFLGRQADLSTAVFELAVRMGSPVVPCVSIPKPYGGYRIIYHPPLHASDSGTRDERVRDLASRCHRVAEAWIQQNPDTWFWFHDLWKAGPTEAEVRRAADESATVEARPGSRSR